jgi:3-hydroxybutyryl-CoA dehydrogenase
VGRPYLVEAVRMLEAGRASARAIDSALEAAGYPVGPFRLLDERGLARDLEVTERLYAALDEAPRFAPPRLQRELVAAGRLGRASGRGFYRYLPDVSTVDVDVEVVDPYDPGRIVERLELAIVNEAYRVAEEGIATAPDIDRVMRLEAGHPQGPFEIVDRLGLRHIVARLRVLHEETRVISGDQYAVAMLLWQVATV